MNNRAKLNELNTLVLDSLLERIKNGEKVNASLLSQAIAYLKINDLRRVDEGEGSKEDEHYGEEELKRFFESYPRFKTFGESEDAE